MPDPQETTAFIKIKQLLSENLNEKWSIASKITNGTDYHFQIFSPPGLFGPKLLAEISVLDRHRRVVLQIVHANKSQQAILNTAYQEMYQRLLQISFPQE